jgi:MFS family permease
LPLYLADLGLSASGIGVFVTATLAGSAGLTWAIRAPAERLGARVALLSLAGLSVVAAVLLLLTRAPWVVVVAAMLGNVAVGAGETGPFLSIEQVVIARAVGGARRTTVLSVYNLLGYAAAGLGAIIVGLAAPRALFAVFLAGSAAQALLYARLPAVAPAARRAAGAGPSAALIRRLAALFALDSFAGGFVLQSLIAYWLHVRFALAPATIGAVFFAAQMLAACSLLIAVRASRWLGLVNTMVFSHLVSNIFLIAMGFAPTPGLAVALLLARALLSQMDVPTRQAYVMAIVEDHEREAAATATNLARTAAQAVTPALTGWVMQAVALSAPFALGGGLKIVYDLLLYWTFKDVKLKRDA